MTMWKRCIACSLFALFSFSIPGVLARSHVRHIYTRNLTCTPISSISLLRQLCLFIGTVAGPFSVLKEPWTTKAGGGIRIPTGHVHRYSAIQPSNTKIRQPKRYKDSIHCYTYMLRPFPSTVHTYSADYQQKCPSKHCM